jgi:hypothetical protein
MNAPGGYLPMLKNTNYKGICLGIIVLFILSTWTPISGKTDLSIYKESISNNTQQVQEQDAIVTCSVFGIGNKDTKKRVIMLQSEAKGLLEKIEAYSKLLHDPQSTKAINLQEEIINHAIKHNLIPKDTLSTLRKMQLPQQRILSVLNPAPMSTADEWFCNYAAGGEGGATPVIIFPRLTPILLFPIPRLFYRWNARYGFASCGGLRSGTGFMAEGEQTGRAIGFWGIGFSVFLPPVMAFGIIGYALYCSVEADHIEFWPPNYPPEVNAVYPLDGSSNIPIATTELSFHIDDYENELMSYSVITNPDVGGANANLKPDGTYTVPISGLEGTETYSWTVTVSDGPNTIDRTFTFSTESVAPIVDNPTPEDGEQFVPITISDLQCHIRDPQGDSMDYTVETSPDIGSGSGTIVGEGWINTPVHGLDNMTEYIWYVNVTDGSHWKHKTFSFQTEPMMFFDPFDEGWQYRKIITINHTKVAGNLENFPILISIIDTDLRDKAQTDGDDILFMDGADTAKRLYHEIEHFDASTGELIVWINVSQLSSSMDTILCLYYGNPTAAMQAIPERVWTNHFNAVWHLNTLYDSSKYNNHGINHGTINTAGKIGTATSFDGINDYIEVPNDPSINFHDTNKLSISLWAYNQDATASKSESLLSKGTGAYDRGYNLYINKNTNLLGMAIKDGNIGYSHKSKQIIYENQWFHVVVMWDGTTQYSYINGEFDNSTYHGPVQLADDTKILEIGNHWAYTGNNHPLHGIVDELHLSDTVRSPEWIQTQFSNQNNPNTFYLISPEETGP